MLGPYCLLRFLTGYIVISFNHLPGPYSILRFYFTGTVSRVWLKKMLSEPHVRQLRCSFTEPHVLLGPWIFHCPKSLLRPSIQVAVPGSVPCDALPWVLGGSVPVVPDTLWSTLVLGRRLDQWASSSFGEWPRLSWPGKPVPHGWSSLFTRWLINPL